MELRPEDLRQLHNNPYEIFRTACKTKVTLHDYESALKKITCEYLAKILVGDPAAIEAEDPKIKQGRRKAYSDADFIARITELVNRAKNDRNWAESLLVTLFDRLDARTKLPPEHPEYFKRASVVHYLKATKKLMNSNGIPIGWALVENQVSDTDVKDRTRDYLITEIQRILELCDPANAVAVVLAAASGIRRGAFSLKWGEMYPVYDYEGKYYFEDYEVTENIVQLGKVACVMIRVYADTTSEYVGFATPEFWNYLQTYKKVWIRKAGREPTPNDWLFIKEGPFARRLSIGGLNKRMNEVVKTAGMRPQLPKGQRRHKVPLFNGYRRFFNKQNKKAYSKNSVLAALIFKETMMGHDGIIKLDKNYFKEHIHELIEEYIQAVPYLTIDDIARRQIELDKRGSIKDSEIRKVVDEALLDKLDAQIELRIQKITNEMLQKKMDELLEAKKHDDK